MARTKVFDEKQVLTKAMELFWNKGYNGASAQDIVDYLGLSRSSLYDTFGDKHGLFIKALGLYRDINESAVREKLDKATDMRKAIQEILQQAIEESLSKRFTQGCFMVNTTTDLATHDAEVAAIVNTNRATMESIFTEAIRRGQKKGQILADHSPAALASFLFNTYAGIRVAARSGNGDKKSLDNILKLFMSLI